MANTRLSSNTAFTSGQLTAFFPTDNTADTLATINFARQLVLDGFLDDGQYEQIQRAVGVYIVSLAEAYTLGMPTTHGTAGSTSRGYRIVPTYSLPTTFPVASTAQSGGPSVPSGVLPFRMWANPPAQGYVVLGSLQGTQAIPGNQPQGRTRCYGQMQSAQVLTTSNAVLSASNYNVIVMPAASADSPDVLFDLLVCDTGTPAPTTPYYMIASGLAPAATFNDTGVLRQPYSMYDPLNHYTGAVVRFAQSEVGVDTGTSPHTRLYAINTFVAPWVEPS